MSALGKAAIGAWGGLATTLAPVLRAHLRARARQGKEIADRLAEREGHGQGERPEGRLVWLHAASVGETVSILPVLTHLVPRARVLLTTGTVTAATLFTTRAAELGLTNRVIHRFAPLDVPAWVRRFLDHWRPDAAVFVESELWPAQLRELHRRGVRLMLLNARMSPASFRRWSRLRPLIRPMLGAFTTIWARGAEDAARFAALGRPDAKPAGDLKLAAPALPHDPAELATLRAMIGARPILVAASTHPGEEALIASVHAALAATNPAPLTVIVPRHPERGSALAQELGAPRRAAGAPPPLGGLWIADTLGELGLWYRLADAVFIGRSLLPPGGGQNPLEPARLGCPVVTGPWMANFTEPMALLRAASAVREVTDTAALTTTFGALLADREAAQAMGERARQAVSGADNLPPRAAAAILGLIRPERG